MLWLCGFSPPGNVPKLLLAVESIVFDVVFMVQHYVLYTNRADPVAKLNQDDTSADTDKPSSGDQYEQLHSPINRADDEKSASSNGYH